MPGLLNRGQTVRWIMKGLLIGLAFSSTTTASIAFAGTEPNLPSYRELMSLSPANREAYLNGLRGLLKELAEESQKNKVRTFVDGGRELTDSLALIEALSAHLIRVASADESSDLNKSVPKFSGKSVTCSGAGSGKAIAQNIGNGIWVCRDNQVRPIAEHENMQCDSGLAPMADGGGKYFCVSRASLDSAMSTVKKRLENPKLQAKAKESLYGLKSELESVQSHASSDPAPAPAVPQQPQLPAHISANAIGQGSETAEISLIADAVPSKDGATCPSSKDRKLAVSTLEGIPFCRDAEALYMEKCASGFVPIRPGVQEGKVICATLASYDDLIAKTKAGIASSKDPKQTTKLNELLSSLKAPEERVRQERTTRNLKSYVNDVAANPSQADEALPGSAPKTIGKAAPSGSAGDQNKDTAQRLKEYIADVANDKSQAPDEKLPGIHDSPNAAKPARAASSAQAAADKAGKCAIAPKTQCSADVIRTHRESYFNYLKKGVNVCIFAGNMSKYTNDRFEANGCEPVNTFSFGTDQSGRKPLVCGKNEVICNPLVFGVKAGASEGSYEPFCVKKSRHSTRDCNAASTDSTRVKDFLADNILGMQEKWNEFADKFNKICNDDGPAQFYCTECIRIRRRLAELNVLSFGDCSTAIRVDTSGDTETSAPSKANK